MVISRAQAFVLDSCRQMELSRAFLLALTRMPTESDKQLCAHLLDLRCHSEDGHKIMLDEYTFGVIGYSIRK